MGSLSRLEEPETHKGARISMAGLCASPTPPSTTPKARPEPQRES